MCRDIWNMIVEHQINVTICLYIYFYLAIKFEEFQCQEVVIIMKQSNIWKNK